MELRADEPFQRGYFHNFHQVALGVAAGAEHAGFLEAVQVVVVELVAVAVTLADAFCSVDSDDLAAGLQRAGVGAQAHGAAQLAQGFLAFHEVNHVVRGVGVDLRAVGVFVAEGGDVVGAGIGDGGHLALRSAGAEARADDDAVKGRKGFLDVLLGEVLAVDVGDIHFLPCVDAGNVKALADALVGVLEVVFADKSDGDGVR